MDEVLWASEQRDSCVMMKERLVSEQRNSCFRFKGAHKRRPAFITHRFSGRRRLRDKPRRGDAARGEAGSGIKTSQRRAAACTLPRQAKGEACGTSPSKRRRHGEASRTSRPDARGRCSPGHTPPRPGAARYSGTSARRRYPRIPALVSNASCLAQQPRRRRMPHIAGLGRPVEAQFASFRSCSCAG